MLHRTLLLFFICLTAVTAVTPARARFYWDGTPVFSALETWEIILVGIILLALTGAFLFILVKLINFFFAKK
ncbi:hypothetical protein [Denitrobaculum tricleocarpae]|uniref:Uncharacterized protein n=1 Tax=Denitrobaculum tricleocarpae TaxID=2591009 RepID=A0A545TTG7_9PROT|nr:hypothetical protein [Denitrobaculum tricleocarpae]TQV80510.1 hypothetical protein FKG95_10050 [Denitrobaculum tricleocarpae]